MFLKPEVHTILFQEVFFIAKGNEDDFVLKTYIFYLKYLSY